MVLGLAMLAMAGTAQAQDMGNAAATNRAADGTIGAPTLRNFELPGARTTPPAPPQEAPAQTPTQAPVEQAAPPPSTSTPAASRAPAPTQPRAEQPAASAPATVEAAPAPLAVPVDMSSVEAAPAFDPPVSAPLPVDTDIPEAPADFPWWAIGLGLALLLGAAFVRSRRRAAVATPAPFAARAPQPARPAPPPAPAQPVPADEPGRPWLEMEFTPARMVASDADVAVHYELAIRNRGDQAAGHLRIEARMFNASTAQAREIDAFFAEPARSRGVANSVLVPAGQTIRLVNRVSMPRDQVREISIGGRPLFIPTVAVTLAYAWGEIGEGQTSKSWLVGIEAQDAEKMGPFRLDLGPRVYRSVGGRPLDLARVA